MKNILNIGLIGYGTVGAGVVKCLIEKKRELKEKCGIMLNLKKIADIDIKKDRGIKIDKSVLTESANDIINDSEIDIVVELIGGINPAREFILSAIKKKKHIVTANKALLSESAEIIFKEANENNVIVNFEASVAGGIPLLKALKEGLIANRITSIYGIVNGTCNYILTNMSICGKSFAEALKEAQDKGFAEANPAFDIEGKDTAHKLAVLAMLAYGIPVKFSDINCEGITALTPLDLKYAHKLNYEIKLLAIAKIHHNTLDLRVHPTLIPQKSILANTNFENNAVYIVGDYTGPTMFYGKGAGMMPTASSVISDIVDIAIKTGGGNDNPQSKLQYFFNKQNLSISPMFALKTKYYLRITTKDKKYVLSNISKILSDNQISIASLLQTETNEHGDAIIIIMTHQTIEKSILNAVDTLKKLSTIKENILTLRVEEDM